MSFTLDLMSLPHSASSMGRPSPSSSSLLGYTENYRWTQGRFYLLRTTASPPAERQTRQTDRQVRGGGTHTKPNTQNLIQSYVESQVIGPLADHMVPRVTVIGQLKLEDVVASGGVSVLIEQNAGACTSCQTERQTQVLQQVHRWTMTSPAQLQPTCT